MLKETVNHLYQQRIFRAVTSAFEYAFQKQKLIHILKFSWLNLQRNNVPPTCSSGTEKSVLNWSSLCPFGIEEAEPKKGLNFAVSYPSSNLNMISVVESAVPIPSPSRGMEF
jgi:hypothetical protein